jgi:enoyl-[acyl-carrier protein] reductase I
MLESDHWGADDGSSNNEYVKTWVKRGARLARTLRLIQTFQPVHAIQTWMPGTGPGVTESRMTNLMQGKRGLIMGVANDHSIAWGIAKTLAAHGAELAFTYQGEALAKRVRPLAESVGASLVLPCDVEDIASVDKVFADIGKAWGKMDFLVHAIAFSDKSELNGRYADTTRENFARTMLISCFAFTEAAKRAAALMPDGGSMLTLTYNGGDRAMPNYNVMGVAKAGLEASVRYLAVDFGGQNIRVNAISAGPIRTLAGAGIGDARFMFAFQQKHSPRGRGVSLDELGGAGLYLLSDLSGGVTGEIHFVDSGYNIIAMPQPDALRGDGISSGAPNEPK